MKSIAHPRRDSLVYEIRDIVRTAQALEKVGKTIIYENIGDPINRGHLPPDFLQEVLSKHLQDPRSFGYGPTQGILETRQYLCETRNREAGVSLQVDDILFFNGLGDAISTVYKALSSETRVLLPAPVYPSYYALEEFHSGRKPVQYLLKAHQNWSLPLEEIDELLSQHPDLGAILLVNPDNPTGKIHDASSLKGIVELCKKHNVLLIVDEIYNEVCFPTKSCESIASHVEDLPCLSLRGLSKSVPWPGARCGWIEFYNCDSSCELQELKFTLQQLKSMEVCATTLPQRILPELCEHSQYSQNLKNQSELYAKRAREARVTLTKYPFVRVNEPEAALYLSLSLPWQEEVGPMPPLESESKEILMPLWEKAPIDKKLSLYLLASTGVCAVPMNSFHHPTPGLRITLLEPDDEKFQKMLQVLGEGISRFMNHYGLQDIDPLEQMPDSDFQYRKLQKSRSAV